MTDTATITFTELQHLMTEWQAKIPVIYYGEEVGIESTAFLSAAKGRAAGDQIPWISIPSS